MTTNCEGDGSFGGFDVQVLDGTFADDTREEHEKALDGFLAEIIKKCPSEYARHMTNLPRFLDGKLPPQILALEPWTGRHWGKLKRALPTDPTRRAFWAALFFEEIHTAQFDAETDDSSHEIIDTLRDTAPDQNDLDRLRREFLMELEQMPAAKHDDFRKGWGWPDADSKRKGITQPRWTRGEIIDRSKKGSDRATGVRIENGSGGRTQFNSPAERMMRFLTAATSPDPDRTRVERETAARITVDILGWSIGGDRQLSHHSLSAWWKALTDDPRRARGQP